MTTEERLDTFLTREPEIPDSAYIAEGAIVIGACTLGENSSIWHGTVLRGDINTIEVGHCSNVQDGTMVHLSDDYGVKIEDYVTIGHAAMIHACTIEEGCLIGMQATILDGSVIGKESIVGAGALVTKGTLVPPGSLVLGSPAKIVRELTAQERKSGRELAEKYVIVSRKHKTHFQQ